MITVFGLEIGTVAFFTFSFVVGIVVALQALFRSRQETVVHRVVKGFIGAAYAAITVLAFLQLEGVQSPYVDIGDGEPEQVQQFQQLQQY